MCLYFIIVILFAVLQVPVLYECSLLSMYYVIACIGMSVNVSGLYYIKVCEQAR